MANIPLKTIKFPGLDDTYTVPQIDSSFTGVAGEVPDSKEVKDEIDSLKEDLNAEKAGVIFPTLTSADFTQGYWSEGSVVSSNTRICSKQMYSVNAGDALSINEGSVQVGAWLYENGDVTSSAISLLGYTDTKPDVYIIPKTGLLLFNAKKSSGNITPSDFNGEITSYKKNSIDIINLKNGFDTAKENFDGCFKVAVPNQFTLESGDISPTSGGNKSGVTNSIRSGYISIDQDTLFDFKVPGYKFLIWVYSAKSISTAQYCATNSEYVSDPVFIRKTSTSNYIRVAWHLTDDGTMTTDSTDPTSDISIISAEQGKILYKLTDTGFSTPNVPADSDAVGKRFDVIDEFNSKLIAYDSSNKSSTTINGVTYSVSNGIATFGGESTDTIIINRIGGANEIPSWIVEGKEYFVEINETGTKNVTVIVNVYKNGVFSYTAVAGRSPKKFVISDMTDVTGIIVRYKIKSEEVVNCTVRVRFFNFPSNEYINTSTEQTPAKIRLMQYNLGKFNYGRPLSGDYHFLTSANFETVLNNYKALLGDIQPDIIGFEEFEDDVLVIGVDGAEDQTVSMNSLLFNRLYPYKDDLTALQSIRSIKSKYPILSSTHKKLYYSWEIDGTTYTGNHYLIYSHVNLYGRNIAFLVDAFPNDRDGYTSEQNLIYRKAVYQSAVELMQDDEYAFIICDANAGSVSIPIIMQDVLIPAGYNSAHGSYFPWQATYESPVDHHTSPIDNIFYKENGKVELVNFKVLWDEKADLASDHAPIYADFLLL